MGDEAKTRRTPVTVTVAGEELSVAPLPWRKRIELGNVIVGNYSNAINVSARIVKDEETGDSKFVFAFSDGVMDYDSMLACALDQSKPDDGFFPDASFAEIIGVLDAALTVNGLERLHHMVDLSRMRPTDPLAEAGTVPAEPDGQRTESTAA